MTETPEQMPAEPEQPEDDQQRVTADDGMTGGGPTGSQTPGPTPTYGGDGGTPNAGNSATIVESGSAGPA